MRGDISDVINDGDFNDVIIDGDMSDDIIDDCDDLRL
jgi:hypothetical protein